MRTRKQNHSGGQWSGQWSRLVALFMLVALLVCAGCGSVEAIPAPRPVPPVTGAEAGAGAATPLPPASAPAPNAAPSVATATPPLQPGAIVGIWNFNRCDEKGVVANVRPGGGGVPAVLHDFAPGVLTAAADGELAPFTIVREGKEASVQVAKSGWATFKNIPDNGLNAGVNTPVGAQALAVFAGSPGNWIQFPGLATALVDHPGGAVRTFGVAMWVLVQTHWKGDHAEFVSLNPLFRFCQTDGRFSLMTTGTDRLYSEDVGNGLGGGYGYQIPWARREAATSRWVHLAFSADGKANTWQVWVNGEPVNYRDSKATSVPWPASGGMQLNFKTGEATDGAVMGRWLGGSGAPEKTIGVAAVVVLKGEGISQERARLLYQLGRRGIPFDGDWQKALPKD